MGDGTCSPDRLVVEQLVHLLEWDALRLGEHEEDPWNGDDHEDGEDEVEAVTDVQEGNWRSSSDGEVV